MFNFADFVILRTEWTSVYSKEFKRLYEGGIKSLDPFKSMLSIFKRLRSGVIYHIVA